MFKVKLLYSILLFFKKVNLQFAINYIGDNIFIYGEHFELTKLCLCAKIIGKKNISGGLMDTVYIVLISVLSPVVLLFVIYLFLAAPKKGRRRMIEKYAKVNYAHRGLHDATRAENSLSAFAAAVDAGYGIELDVRLSKDGELVVFHDDTLDRVTEGHGRVDSKTLSELQELHLSKTDDTVPTFAEVLALVRGRVPLLVEIKEDPFKYGVTEKCAEMLQGYEGEFIVESFNPLALWKFKKIMPKALRGVLSDHFFAEKKYRKPMYFLLQMFMLNFLAAPDFIAFNHERYRSLGFKIQKNLFRPTLFAWTVRSSQAEVLAKKHGFDSVIFEHYTP